MAKKLNVPWWGWTLGAVGASLGGVWYWNRAYPRGVIVKDPATKMTVAEEVYPTYWEARDAARRWEDRAFAAQIVDLPKGVTSFQQLQQQAAGLGDCGCGCNGQPGGCGGNTRGLGTGAVGPETWYGAGDNYQPFGPALAARQAMIPPMPSGR